MNIILLTTLLAVVAITGGVPAVGENQKNNEIDIDNEMGSIPVVGEKQKNHPIDIEYDMKETPPKKSTNILEQLLSTAAAGLSVSSPQNSLSSPLVLAPKTGKHRNKRKLNRFRPRSKLLDLFKPRGTTSPEQKDNHEEDLTTTTPTVQILNSRTGNENDRLELLNKLRSIASEVTGAQPVKVTSNTKEQVSDRKPNSQFKHQEQDSLILHTVNDSQIQQDGDSKNIHHIHGGKNKQEKQGSLFINEMHKGKNKQQKKDHQMKHQVLGDNIDHHEIDSQLTYSDQNNQIIPQEQNSYDTYQNRNNQQKPLKVQRGLKTHKKRVGKKHSRKSSSSRKGRKSFTARKRKIVRKKEKSKKSIGNTVNEMARTSKSNIRKPRHGVKKDKATSSTIRRYRYENEDGSITWGYYNDDGSFKEETIGVDCVTRGKFGYIDPTGEVREYSYSSGILCDPETKLLIGVDGNLQDVKLDMSDERNDIVVVNERKRTRARKH